MTQMVIKMMRLRVMKKNITGVGKGRKQVQNVIVKKNSLKKNSLKKNSLKKNSLKKNSLKNTLQIGKEGRVMRIHRAQT
jgi:hypothetical protein